ncbi:MAG: NADH-quinone oxidoreductase subunit NuoH [Gemmataceae bacterium]|nr:NADH-quinone oxidoreductase subunit NuoH [Gemmataceae bacterium]
MHDFDLLTTLLTIAAVIGVILGTCGFLIYVERKVAAYVQDRVGPNRVGPWGLFQSVADGLKFLLKEDIIPRHVDKFLYLLAPAVALSTALLAFSVVPFGPTDPPPIPPVPPQPPVKVALNAPEAERAAYQERLKLFEKERTKYEERLRRFQTEHENYRGSYQFVIAPGLDIGIVFVFAVSSLAVYGIILGGWAGNNKYSLLGALRSSAQIISYEIPLGMSVLGVVLLASSLNPERIIHEQGVWFVAFQPLAFLIFMTSSFAECNRVPFDLPEAEQELVGGYHTEYSAMKFAMFFLAEYTHMITTSFLMVVLFFGGWQLPPLVTADSGWFLKLITFAGKMALFIIFYMLVRWTIPRFRFDQLMALAWKVLIPLALANLVCVMVVKHLMAQGQLGAWAPWLLPPLSVALLVGAGLMAARMEPPARRAPRVPVGGAARVEVPVR